MMKNVSKYQRQYFMPPVECNDWVKKTYVDKAPPDSFLYSGQNVLFLINAFPINE